MTNEYVAYILVVSGLGRLAYGLQFCLVNNRLFVVGGYFFKCFMMIAIAIIVNISKRISLSVIIITAFLVYS